YACDIRRHAQHDVLAFHYARNLVGLLQDLGHHSLGALDVTRTFAIRAGRTKGTLQALLDAFASDGHQSEIVELENFVGRAIGPHGLFKRLHHLLTILTLVHVDEVHHDDAAEVAQADLADNFLDGVGIGLDDGVLEAIRLAHELAGVYVDGHQGFGLIDDD